MKPANFAVVYACMYPQLAEISRLHGYALAAHGSMARDFDLINVPWVDTPSDPQEVINAMTEHFAIQQIGEPTLASHKRLVYTLSLSFGDCFLDMSFMPCA